MKRSIATGGSVALAVLILGGILLLELQGRDTEDENSGAGVALLEPGEVTPPEAASVHPDAIESSREENEIASRTSGERQPESPTVHYCDDIEEIKRQVYEREIESIERIHLLDELVQTGDADVRKFWGADWNGVDDWKRASNGFRLENADDGTLIFIPDEETARTYTFFENLEVYTYDEANRAFVNEIDYYGKTIVNVVKFINDDVLAMMTISGRKVDLSLYQRNAGEP
jgi:hypothetical protein